MARIDFDKLLSFEEVTAAVEECLPRAKAIIKSGDRNSNVELSAMLEESIARRAQSKTKTLTP